MKKKLLLLAAYAIFLFAPIVSHAAVLPAKIQAALLIKLGGFEKKLSSAGEISIYVYKAPDIAGELKKGIGKPIGKSTLATVDEGDSIPTKKYDIIYIGSKDNIEELSSWSQANGTLSLTGVDGLSFFVTLTLANIGGKPKFLLNLNISKSEGLDWNPAILKAASIVN